MLLKKIKINFEISHHILKQQTEACSKTENEESENKEKQKETFSDL